MRKLLCLFFVIILCLTAANGFAEGLLGNLEERLEPMEGSDFLFYTQLNNVLAYNRIVYDASHIYFAWGNSLYCANYDGSFLWELTDTLEDDSPIALQGDRIYCIVNNAGTSYFAAIKTDGSEMPDKIIAISSLIWELKNSDNGSSNYRSSTTGVYRIVVPRNSGGNVLFSYWLAGQPQNYNSYYYQIGIASYNVGERTFSNVRSACQQSNMSVVSAFWYQDGIMTYEINNNGIRRYDLAETYSNVISNSHPKRVIDMLGRIYFIEQDTGRFYTIAYTGSQKTKILDGLTEFVITQKGLLLYTKNDGFYAADEKGQNSVLITDAITGRFYLMGDWVYYYTDDNIQRLSLHDGTVQVVFDPSWV